MQLDEVIRSAFSSAARFLSMSWRSLNSWENSLALLYRWVAFSFSKACILNYVVNKNVTESDLKIYQTMNLNLNGEINYFVFIWCISLTISIFLACGTLAFPFSLLSCTLYEAIIKRCTCIKYQWMVSTCVTMVTNIALPVILASQVLLDC